MRKLIFCFGVLNAVLFSALLPLWEGFDEAFHYSYVETLWQKRALPVLGRTLVAGDVERSFGLAPVSHVVHDSYPRTITFDEWFQLPDAEKVRRRAELESLRPKDSEGTLPNYEAHQPPLAYAALAVADRMFERAPLTVRVLLLRISGAMGCMVLLYLGALRLCRALLMPERYRDLALFTVFCSEMLYASASHVANDWLALGVGAMFFGALAEFAAERKRQGLVRLGCWLAAGLLTKAYFLALVPVAAAVALENIPWLLLTLLPAVPWYARNLMLYGNIGGTHEAFNGIGMRQAMAAAGQIDWPATAGYLARGSLWTGNNSFTTFSRGTLNLMLVVVCAALTVWVLRRGAIRRAEWAVFGAVGAFCAAVVYATCVTFADRHGQTAGASPWYTQILLLPVVALAYLGLSRRKKFGAAPAACLAALASWVLIATWAVKLFPLYAGAGGTPLRGADLWHWYIRDVSAHTTELSLVSLAPGGVLCAGMLLSVSLCVFIAWRAIYRLVKLNET